jgi:DNA helicase-2/ATP-dependent DNA helicase PcrA
MLRNFIDRLLRGLKTGPRLSHSVRFVGITGPQGHSRNAPLTSEGDRATNSTGVVSAYKVGDRVSHKTFGNGDVRQVEGDRLTIAFDRTGVKKVVDSFVTRA